jgi:hypothetical protein
MDSMMLVNKNVEHVELNVLLVIEITTVSLVKTLTGEPPHLVIAQLVGKITKMVLIVLKSHPQMVSTN